MNKKGFTIVELLAAIVILGLIVTIVYPAVISTIRSSEKKAHDSQVKTIERAMKLYYLDHSNELKDLNENGTMDECENTTNETVEALIEPINTDFTQRLINEGYIFDNETKNGKLIDPCTDRQIEGTVSVKWICKTKQYEYKYNVTDEQTKCN